LTVIEPGTESSRFGDTRYIKLMWPTVRFSRSGEERPPPVIPTGGLSKLNSVCAGTLSRSGLAFRPSPVDMLGEPASASGRADTL
jgi:hypothetical protein